MGQVMMMRRGGQQTGGGMPRYTYTGSSEFIDDGDSNWRIKFLTSGTLTIMDNRFVDVFLVGGGGAGSRPGIRSGGGGGGYTATHKKITIQRNMEYPIVVGASAPANTNGNSSSAFGHIADGGKCTNDGGGGNGGSGGGGGYQSGNGGAGGSDGSNGTTAYGLGGAGQGSTTREFGEPTGTLYAGGGGGSSDYKINYIGVGGAGGAGGGGAGGNVEGSGKNGANNYGGGGGGINGAGGSGIVIIRNTRL